MKKVIVFGNDHTNSVGVIQSLGKAGYRSIGLVYGFKNDFVKSSKYVERVISAKDAQACIDKLVEANFNTPRENANYCYLRYGCSHSRKKQGKT